MQSNPVPDTVLRKSDVQGSSLQPRTLYLQLTGGYASNNEYVTNEVYLRRHVERCRPSSMQTDLLPRGDDIPQPIMA